MMSLHEISSEKRLFSRIAFDAPVILNKGNEQWTSKLLDISLKGALVVRPDDWQQENDGEFKLAIKLDNSDVEIDMDVTLAHTEEDHIGFHCEHIDLDSVTSLKRLVELNLGDEELLEREILNMLSD
jgi:beta-lactamase superfamily II metal-dependent hydrolase